MKDWEKIVFSGLLVVAGLGIAALVAAVWPQSVPTSGLLLGMLVGALVLATIQA